jgi:DNA repair exonuclease SbcCD ATPase subunit
MKIIRLVLPLLFISFLSCNEAEKKEIERLKAENTALNESSMAKDSVMMLMLDTFTQIENNLSEIRGTQNTIDIRTSHNEKVGSSKERILSDIAYINGLLADNQTQLEELQSQLSKAKAAQRSSNKKVNSALDQIGKMEELIKQLSIQNEQKNLEIEALKEELISMNYELDKISMAYAKELQKTEEQKEKINTAYYAIGTFKELKNANILTKKGSFIGMGGARALVEDFNKDQFIEIDITEVKDILIDAKKAQLATNHAEGSYEFEEVDGVVTKLVILDPVEFWSVSKFLVIVK